MMEDKPSRMFDVLRRCGALKRILPELDALAGVPQPAQYHPEIDTFVHVMMVVDTAASRQLPLPTRVAALLHDLGKGTTDPADWPKHIAHEARGVILVEQLCKRLKVQNELRDLAVMTSREHGNVGRAAEMRAATIVKLFERCDAFRKPARFAAMLDASECDHLGREGFADRPYPQKPLLLAALAEAQAVNAGAIAAEVMVKAPEHASEKIAAAVHAGRVHAVDSALKKTDPSS
jgi:tRNA nucleotidyltransferase (CCA-adding enzyme)